MSYVLGTILVTNLYITEEKGITADDYGVANLLKTQYESIFTKLFTNVFIHYVKNGL